MTASTVEATIASRVDAGSGALIGYLPVGFPDLDTSVEAAVALVENGVDIIELGLPYSDPVMDGLAIQAATQAALERGFRLRDGFTALERIRSRVDAPVLVMTYWNPIYQFGIDRFARSCSTASSASGVPCATRAVRGSSPPTSSPMRPGNGSRSPKSSVSTGYSSPRPRRALPGSRGRWR